MKEAVTPVFGPFVNEIPILLFEYEYRFTENEHEKNQRYESPAKCKIYKGQKMTRDNIAWEGPKSEPNPYQLEWNDLI
ncbi:MAG: hypothetical protein LW724_12390, partial [Planctomycetaceae bacterium]|nr:hypothetical protein [Planctomycetaceae bacterium]